MTPFHLDEWPILRLDYRMPDQVRVGILLRIGEEWLSVILSPNQKARRKGQHLYPLVRDGRWHRAEVDLEKVKPERRSEYLTALAPGCDADGAWHAAEIDLLDYVKRRFPDRKHYRVRAPLAP